MAEEVGKNTTYEQEVSKTGTETETETETEPKTDTQEGTMASTDRGLFDFMKKKEDDKTEEVVATEFENKVNVSEVSDTKVKEEEEKKHKGGVSGLVEKLHRSDSSSSSSSDDEGDDEEKKKKKKEKKEKKGLKDKINKDKEDPNVPIEKYHDDAQASSDKKEQGFLDKIKEKLPGSQQKKATAEYEHAPAPAPAPAPPVVHATEPCTTEGETKEKKGFLDKIKEKIPGFHSKNGDHEEKKEEIKRESE